MRPGPLSVTSIVPACALAGGAGEMALRLPERCGGAGIVLGQIPAAGERHKGDGAIFWTKGDEALPEVDGKWSAGYRPDFRRGAWAGACARGSASAV